MASKTQSKYWEFKGGLDLVSSALKIDPGRLLGCKNYEIAKEDGYRRIDGYERFDGRDKPSDASYWILNFDAGQTEVSDGETVTGVTSGATGIACQDGELLSGTYAGGDAEGTLVLYGVSGTFQDNENLQVSAATVAVANGTTLQLGASTKDLDNTYLQAAIEATRAVIEAVPGSGAMRGVWVYNNTVYAFRDNAGGTATDMYKSSASGWTQCSLGGNTLTAGGRFEFVNHNFSGHSGSRKMYGVNGKDKAFQWDGTTFTPITTGMATDTPIHIAVHQNYLILAFPGGSLQHSGVLDPTSWSVVTGAGEVATGEEITGMMPTVGNVLAVFCRNRTFLLTGTGHSNWALETHSMTSGAIEWSMQHAQTPIYLDDRGLTIIEQTEAFGDFQDNTISRDIQARIDAQKAKVTAAVVCRSKNQYIICFDDDTAIVGTFKNRRLQGFMDLDYSKTVRCIVSGEDANGDEQIFFGSDDGYIYELNAGTSFDGSAVTAFLRTPYNHFSTPRVWKRFHQITLEMNSGVSPDIELEFAPEFSYSDPNTPSETPQDFTVAGGGGFWDSAIWNQFYWGGQVVGTLEGYLDGIGYNMSLLINSSATYESPHTIHGAIVNYAPKGRVR
jgi:hypothetical protein